jgi:glycerol-3-phosphate dehydrogenase (NAD(P)+)
MAKTIKNISVIGDGGWGTTLAIYLARRKFKVKLWGPFPEYVQHMRKTRINQKFLPGISIPTNVDITNNLIQALKESELIVLAVPSQFIQSVLENIKKTNVELSQKYFLSVTKGIENRRLMRMSEMVKASLGKVQVAVLSGPNIAREVVKGVPSTAVVASSNLGLSQQIQKIFSSKTFRIYTNSDMVGVELGGSLKNVIAIACGVCDGLGYGTNTKAAIMTRGLAEIVRLGKILGANPKTFYGLSGLGDLATTCFNPSSRNRSVGEALGQGKSLKSILSSMNMIAEGVETVKAAYELSRKKKIDMPIIRETFSIIYKGKRPDKAVTDLMSRSVKSET